MKDAPPTASCVSYKGFRPTSPRASLAARGSSKKADTRCEIILRHALWTAGYRYRKNVSGLPGRPDIAFPGVKVAIFCDGDFWHGRDWEIRREKLAQGTNSAYWLAKIQRNMERDHRNDEQLQSIGWTVLRFWESQIQEDLTGLLERVREVLGAKGLGTPVLDSRRHHGVKRT